MLHIRFDDEGRAAGIFNEPRPDTEPLDVSFIGGDVITFLAANRCTDLARATDPAAWVKREPVKVEPPDPAQIEAERQAALEAERAAALARVKDMTAAARNMVFTDLPGQDAIYLQKRVEAGRYLAEQPKALDGFPFLAAEVGVTAPDAYQLAQLWLNRGHMFEVIGAMTEGARLTATNAIAAARTIDAVHEAEAAFAAALVKMGVAQ